MISRARSSMFLPRNRLSSTHPAACRAELPDHPIHQLPAGRRSIEKLVVDPHRLPLEGTHLVERLHLDPLDVLHRRDKTSDAVDIGGIIGLAGDEGEADPDRLGQRSKSFRETQRWREVAACHPTIGIGIRTLDVEQHEIDVRKVAFVGATPEKPRGLNGGMQTQFLRTGEYPPGERKLHHRLAAGNRESPTKRKKYRREIAQATEYMVG